MNWIILFILICESTALGFSYKSGETKEVDRVPKKRIVQDSSNLPSHYSKRVHLVGDANDAFIIVPEKKENVLLTGLRAGDILKGEIEQAITASPNVPTPVRMKIRTGAYVNSYLLGQGVLDKDLQRVLIEFTRLRLKDKDTTYSLKGQVLSLNGEVGLIGEFHSKEMLFFIGEMLSAGASGYMDATIQRTQNQFGNYQNVPSVETAAKLGTVNALSKTADRFAEKQRLSPGFTTTEGFRLVQAIITEDPVEIN